MVKTIVFIFSLFLSLMIVKLTYAGANNTRFSSISPYKDPYLKSPSFKDSSWEKNHWFTQIQGGVISPSHDSHLLIGNGSFFTFPSNVDVYSLNHSYQGTVALTVGEQRISTSSLINHYTLSGRLQYVFPKDKVKTIMQYSEPDFLNYNNSWKLSALAITADTKLNGFNFAQFSPFINGGLGLSFNHAGSYNESSLPRVSPRIKPAFGSRTLTQITYHVGLGLDYLIADSWDLSAGYEFESFGNFKSRRGKSTWARERLELDSFTSNTFLIGFTYLIT